MQSGRQLCGIMMIIVGVGCWVLYFVVGIHTFLPTVLIIDNKGDDNLKTSCTSFWETAIENMI